MQCPSCGYVLGPFERSCPKCARLGTTQQAVSGAQAGQPAANAAPAYKACGRCGALAVLSQAACGRCGLPFAAGSAEPPRPKPEWVSCARPRTGVWVVAIVVVLVALLVGAVALVVRPSGGERREGGAPGVYSADGRGGGSSLTGASAVASDQIDKRLAEASAKTGGDVEVSLAWNGYTDLDLAVRDPSGALTDFVHPTTDGGELDVDANAAGIVTVGAGPANAEEARRAAEQDAELNRALAALGTLNGESGGARCIYTDKPVEHIYATHAARGVYSVYVRCYNWREVGQTPLRYTVQIKMRGRLFRQIDGLAGPESFVSSGIAPTIVTQFEVR